MGNDKAALSMAPEGGPNDRSLAGISAAGSRSIQQNLAEEGGAASTQSIAVGAFLLDKALRAATTPGDRLSTEGGTPAGVPVATTTITDSLRQEHTVSSAERIASSAPAVDQIMADIFKDDDFDFIGQGVVDDTSGAASPPDDGETPDDFFGELHDWEQLAPITETLRWCGAQWLE